MCVTALTISELKSRAGETPLLAAVMGQLQSRTVRTTKTGKPYLELAFADATGHFTLKIWSDSPVYADADAMPVSSVSRIEAKWTQGGFGLETKELVFHAPESAALDAFYAGDPKLLEQQRRDYEEIVRLCSTIADPRFSALCRMFLDQHGERFRRTAAARRNHHARRGGLVEHVARMMQSADALCAVYPAINRDLLIAGVLFHDCGKLWENSYPEHGFNQSITLHGELMGHIPLGIELVNRLWRDLMAGEEAAAWRDLQPTSEEARLHLLHLIGSHHGEHQFGSPVLPRTREAFALHFIDNLDAKLEMLEEAYARTHEIAPGVLERVHPLQTNIVRSLPVFVAPAEEGG
jgi:3'-5' exoribonuclease